MKTKPNKELSNCCNAQVHVHSEEEGTNYYECNSCGKPCDLKYWNPNKQKTDWEKEFNYIFPDGIIPTDIDNIKKFISQLLLTQRQKLISEIEGIVGEDEKGEFDQYWMANQLRKEIRERLKQITNLKEK